MEIKVLGPGCRKCQRLDADVRAVVKELGVDAEVTKVENLDLIVGYGVFLTPGLVINGDVKVAGRVPKKAEIKKWIIES
ncbi:MAG: TM0996/MTH895 family glutaredoxin-like protein [Candidatus Desulforudis sp.]|nr:TM0996/MTH895 family glutaredoxin-like protein [Desulforudis sp.]